MLNRSHLLAFSSSYRERLGLKTFVSILRQKLTALHYVLNAIRIN